MLTLEEVKTWLRLEQEDTTEDTLLQSLIAAAEEYLRGALTCWIDPALNPPAKILVLTLIADMYENREMMPNVQFAAQISGKRPTVQTLLAQLRYVYPTITTGRLPDATVGVPYTATLQAEGGTEPYTWNLIENSLPEGLVLDGEAGTISGTPAVAGRFVAVVQLTDSNPTPRIVSRPVVLMVVAAT